MQELVGRLAELDPDAGAAVKVIAYFDRLVELRAGLEPIVRGAAVLAGCAARLVDRDRHVQIRVDERGKVRAGVGQPEPGWPAISLRTGGPAALWLERQGPVGPVEAMVLERAASAARAVLERTRSPADTAGADRASVEVLLDASATAASRLRAARRLGLADSALARVVALADGRSRIETDNGASWPAPNKADERAGIGPLVELLDLPASRAAARTALRLTAEGTESDPGPRVVHADRLGGLTVLAETVGPETEPIPDVLAVRRARASAPWVLATLVAVARSPSMRTAAVALRVHHSTLQERLGHLERLLGWPIREPDGRFRLQLALALLRLHENA